MLATGIRTPVGVKVFGRDLTVIERPRPRDRGGDQVRAGHVQRLRRAHHRRLLPGDRAGPRRSWRATASWSATCSRSSPPRSAPRRSRPRSRAASATLSAFAIPRDMRSDPQAIAQRSARAPARTARRSRWARLRRSSWTQGPGLDPDRERAACGLHLRRCARSRSRQLCRRRRKAVVARRSNSRPATTPSGAASSNTTSAPSSGSMIVVPLTLLHHLPAALPELPAHDRNA